MTGFYESLRQGDDQFFKDAGVNARYEGELIRAVVQPYEESMRPSVGGMSMAAAMQIDVMNADVIRLGIKSGKKIEVKNMAGGWQMWLIDGLMPSAWTTTLKVMPTSGNQGGGEF